MSWTHSSKEEPSAHNGVVVVSGSTGSTKIWRITQVVEGVGLENR